jgi:hypothetical protein
MQNDDRVLQDIIRRLERIERLIKAQAAPKKKQVWIRSIDVMRMTGWKKDDMYRLRKTGVLVFKKVKTTYLYDPDSIPEIFIKKHPDGETIDSQSSR